MTALLSSAVALIVASLAFLILRRFGGLPLNLPNERSLHQQAIPRGGGLAIWAGWFVALAWTGQAQPQPLLIPLIVLIAVSLCDDRYNVAIGWRLLAHVACAAGWVWLASPAVNIALAIVIIVCAMNFYNFMDGSDGLAATMTLVGFATYAIAALLGNAVVGQLAATLAAATIPFFFLNFPPARVFLGDVGSVPLGFLAAVFGISGIESLLWPFWFPVLVFLPFIADATVTLARRTLRGDRIWRAHREHYYQRLVRMGFGHSGVLALYGALMVGSSLSALAALERSPASGMAVLSFWVAVHAMLFSTIDHAWRKSDERANESKC